MVSRNLIKPYSFHHYYFVKFYVYTLLTLENKGVKKNQKTQDMSTGTVQLMVSLLLKLMREGQGLIFQPVKLYKCILDIC